MSKTMRTLLLKNTAMHLGCWALSAAFATACLYASHDAWYVMARERFIGRFLWLQISWIPHYLALSLLVAFWRRQISALWQNLRPAQAQRSLWFLLWTWCWFSLFSTSLMTRFANWSVPLAWVRENFGVTVSYTSVSAFKAPVYANLALFVTVTLLALLTHILTLGFRSLFAGMLLVLTLAQDARVLQFTRTLTRSDTQLPSIVVIGSDSLRADRLGLYGYARPTSPTLDRLGKNGVVCDRVYVPTPSTTESLLSWMTGQMPRETQIRSIFPSYRAVKKARTLPQYPQLLQKAGYRTVALGDWSASDFDRMMSGFDEIDVEKEMNFVDYLDGAVKRCQVFLMAFFNTAATEWLSPGLGSVLQNRHSHEAVLDRAEAEISLAAQGNYPLFLFVFLSTTHFPYTLPHDRPPVFGDPAYRGRHHHQIEFGTEELVQGSLVNTLHGESQRLVDLYDSAVLNFDRQVERLYQSLDRNGLAQSTLLVILSDHGEDHWDPDTSLGRSIHAGNQSIRVPLIFHWPDRLQPRRLPALLRSTDFAATLADLLSLPWTSGGLSFRPHLEGKKYDDDRLAFIEGYIPWMGPRAFAPEEHHLSHPAITDLTVPDMAWETQLVIPDAALQIAMRAKDRALLERDLKVVYRPLQSGPWLYACDLRQDPHCRRRIPPPSHLVKRLYEEITQDPEDFYLAWPRAVFDQAFLKGSPI